MGEVLNTQDAYSWSISRIAEAIQKDRRTVAKLIQEAGIPPAGTRRGNPVYALGDVFDALDRGSRPPVAGGIDVNELLPQDRKAWFQSENERIKLEKELRHLVPDHEMAREMSRFAKNIAAALESLPDVLERDAGIEGEALDVVQRVADEFREQMYRDYIGGDDDD